MSHDVSTTSAARLLALATAPGLGWTATWIVALIDAIWVVLGRWKVSLHAIAPVAIVVVALLLPLVIGRYRRDLRIRTTLSGTALFFSFQAVGATLSYLVVSTNADLVDAPLSAWDRALGFDWLAFHAWLQEVPWIQAALHYAYFSGLVQLLVVVLILGFVGQATRLDEFMRLFIVASVVVIVLSGIFPAAGAWKYYNVGKSFDLASLSHFELLRGGRMREIPMGDMQGLVSMPSMHAATAVLLMYVTRGTLVNPPFVVLNTAMIASTPIDGGHYLVDVLAGLALAFGLIAMDRRRDAARKASSAPAVVDERRNLGTAST